MSVRSTGLALSLTASMIAGFEGVRHYAYLDPVGIPTACFGMTEGVKMGQRFTEAECEEHLFEEVIKYQRAVRARLKRPIEPHVLAATTSWTYNVGIRAMETSTLMRRLDAGDTVGACNELPRWNKATLPGGIKIVLPGLTNRRAVERSICLGESA